MTAMTVTPEMVRVAFLRSNGRILRLCCVLSCAIISALDWTLMRWCFAAVRAFSLCRSFCVGLLSFIRQSMISLAASFGLVEVSIHGRI